MLMAQRLFKELFVLPFHLSQGPAKEYATIYDRVRIAFFMFDDEPIWLIIYEGDSRAENCINAKKDAAKYRQNYHFTKNE